MNKLKPFLTSFAIFLIVCAVTTKIADLSFGFFYDEKNTFQDAKKKIKRSLNLRELYPNFDAVVNPSAEILMNSDSLKKKEYRVRVDENGFIENRNEKLTNLDKKSIRIIFFGGSTTESMYVEEQNRFVSRLERNLRQEFNEVNIFIHNAGVSGNHSLHSLLSLIGKGVSLKPDFVVLMNNMNDLGTLRMTGSYWLAPNTRSILKTEGNLVVEDNTSYLFITALAIKNLLLPNIYNY